MRKGAAIFLAVVLCLIFAGAVSAQEAPEVDVAVVYENGTNVTVAEVGEEVAVDVKASANDATINQAWVKITIDPSSGFEFEPEKAMMWDGTQWVSNADPIKGDFFFWYSTGQYWAWDISWVMGPLQPGETSELIAPGLVNKTGPITVYGDLYGGYPIEQTEPYFYDSDNYTFYGVAAASQNGTVPMQETGSPVGMALLGILSILGGAAYSKFR